MLKKLRHKTSEFISSCPPKLAVLWFWITMTTTTYCGICHVLPTIYTQEWLLTLKRVVGIVLFIEMTINWICLRFVTSRYQPLELDRDVSTSHIGGFEIDLDQLRTRAANGSRGRQTHSLPLTSIRPIGDSPCNRWNHDTMYLVSLHADEACFVTSNKCLQFKSHKENDWFNDEKELEKFKSCDDDDDADDAGDDDDLSFVSSPESLHSSNHALKSTSSNSCNYPKEHSMNGSIKNGINKRQNIGIRNNFENNTKEQQETFGDTIGRTRDLNDSEDERRTEGKRVVVYPYWSWKPCKVCDIIRPPRAHHCRMCGYCVLKRDHHCFFVSTCVGLNNQRHFVVFLFWSSISIVFSLVQSAIYIVVTCFCSTNIDTIHCLSNTILPVTIYRLFRGSTETFDLLLVLVLYSLIWFFLVCFGFFVDQVRLIVYNCTSFEKENSIKVVRRTKRGIDHPPQTSSSRGGCDQTSDAVAFKCPPNEKADKASTLIGNACRSMSDIDEKSIWRQKIKRWNRNLFWVFGKNWLLNFVVPLHFVYPTPEDGVHWRSVEC